MNNQSREDRGQSWIQGLTVWQSLNSLLARHGRVLGRRPKGESRKVWLGGNGDHQPKLSITSLYWFPGDKPWRELVITWKTYLGSQRCPPQASAQRWGKTNKGPDLRSPTGPGCVRSWEAHGPVPRTWAGASPALPSWSPTTRSPTCTLLLDQFRCNVFYEHADGMARARGKVLPWDKKLTLANSKFTACIFIFLIPAPSASNWGSTSLFSPLFLQPALF